MTTSDWVQILTPTVALLGVAVTFWLTWRGQKHNRERAERAQKAAEASAERAERSASLTIDSLTDIADALSQMANQILARTSLRPVVKWSLSHSIGDTYQLDNQGTATAFNLAIEHDSSLHARTEDIPNRLGPGEAGTFMAARNIGTRDSTITVRWTDDAEESSAPHEWRYPLPPKQENR